VLPDVPAVTSVCDDPIGDVRKRNEANGRHIGPTTLEPLWSGEKFDPGWAKDTNDSNDGETC
jgi:hypothetical protein